MNKTLVGFCVLLAGGCVLTACSSGDSSSGSEPQPKKEAQHIWKDQTDMMDRARGVETQVLNEVQRRQGEIDQQAR